MKKFSLAMFLCASLLLACRAGPGESCAKSDDCASGLTCFVPADEASSVAPDVTLREMSAVLEAHTCVSIGELEEAAAALGLAAKEEECRQGAQCSAWGWCTYQQGKCVATSDEDCRASQICGLFGRCVVQDAECRAGSDEDCQNSTTCETMNYCRVNERGFCVL